MLSLLQVEDSHLIIPILPILRTTVRIINTTVFLVLQVLLVLVGQPKFILKKRIAHRILTTMEFQTHSTWTQMVMVVPMQLKREVQQPPQAHQFIQQEPIRTGMVY